MKPHDADRIMQLEAMVRQLSRRIEQIESTRFPEITPPANSRLARTIDDGTYPAVDGRYPFVFMDDNPSAGLTARSESRQGLANMPGRLGLLPADTLIWVGESTSGQYYVTQIYRYATVIIALIDTPFTSSNTTVPASSFSLISPEANGQLPPGMASETINNYFKLDGSGGSGAAELRLSISENQWYIAQTSFGHDTGS